MSNREQQSRKIMVGVDGSASARRALEWALAYAEDTVGEVIAVHAWQVPAMYGSAVAVIPAAEFAKEARHWMDRTLDEILAGHPGAQVERRVIEGQPGRVLVEQAKDADLLVVGSRGHGGLVGTIIGSVSHHAIHHAPCPVVVIRGAE